MRPLHGKAARPACVENCPAEVLTLATPAVLDKLVKQRRQRSARLDALPWHSEAVQSAPPQTKRQQMQNTPARGEPDKLSPDARAGHFNEIHLPFRPEQAQREASRCLKCGDHSICEWTCPLHNHIPQWIERIRAGISSVRLSFLTRLTVYRKLPAASVHRIDYVKAPAPCGMRQGR